MRRKQEAGPGRSSSGPASSPLFTEVPRRDSQKLVCRLMHSPARWPLYCYSETSRLLKVNHYMLRTGIKMRSDQYTAPVRTLIRGRGRQEFMGAVDYKRSGCPDRGVRRGHFEGS
jgi:hypothetical protein